MSKETTPSRKESLTAREPERTRNVRTIAPATDIYETPMAIVVVADMPGVDEKHLDVKLENDVLTLHGTPVMEEPAGSELVHRELAPAEYERSFSLSEGVDRNQIKAQIKNGVLRITLPKTKEHQPRKITVEAGP